MALEHGKNGVRLVLEEDAEDLLEGRRFYHGACLAVLFGLEFGYPV